MPSPPRAMRRAIALVLCCVAPLLASRVAGAERGVTVAAASIVRLDRAARQASLNRSPEWLSFRRQHGDWQALWNERTGTPHRAFGRGIALGGFARDASSADRAVRGFIAGHPEMFAGAPDLESLSAVQAGRVWYVRYRQCIDGIPVLFTDWEFRVSDDGRLIAFGADALRASDYRRPITVITGDVALDAAREGLAFDPATDRASVGERPLLLPVAANDGVELRLVYEVTVLTRKPRGEWLTFVDAENGVVRSRVNRVRNAIDGTVTGLVHPNLPTDTKVTVPFKGEWVNVSTTQATTNSAGWYTGTASGTVNVNSRFSGPYCVVLRQDGGIDATFSKNVTNPITQNIAWVSNNSLDSERDAFYHVNKAHDYIKTLDPAATMIDAQVVANVNWIDDECASYWESVTSSLNFTDVGATCPATATMPDVIYHEYCHSVNDRLYFALGSTFGMQNAALQEASADVNAVLMTDDPVFGNGFFGPGTSLRTLDNATRWPENGSPSSHQTGMILGAAMWDLREAIGVATTGHLAHFAKYGTPDDPQDAGVAFSEYFIEVLLADDNDGNLSNGTPNFTAIVNAFNAHGIGTNYFLDVTHTPMPDQATNGPYPVSSVVQYSGPVGSLSSVKIHYSYNSQPYVVANMTPTGNPDEWGAQVPQTSGAVVRYYLEATDSYGGVRLLPAGAPTQGALTFIAGPAFPLIVNDMETSPGWVIGAAGDNALTGIWLRDDPVGTQAQPEDDHTPVGVQCYVTGNADPLDFPGANDVDGGKTTLVTNAFDATGWADPIISYWRWYSNNTGDAPDEDVWRVDISNNGGSSWVPVENTPVSELKWRRLLFFIGDYVTPTANMKMRFIAEDALNPSLVEAAVDDWELIAFPPGVGVEPQPPARRLALAVPSPNPTHGRTAMRIQLPSAGHVSLAVYDIHGRSVRTLVDGALAAGEHVMAWDGRDDRGRAVASGPYFVRVIQDGQTAHRACGRIK